MGIWDMARDLKVSYMLDTLYIILLIGITSLKYKEIMSHLKGIQWVLYNGERHSCDFFLLFKVDSFIENC